MATEAANNQKLTNKHYGLCYPRLCQMYKSKKLNEHNVIRFKYILPSPNSFSEWLQRKAAREREQLHRAEYLVHIIFSISTLLFAQATIQSNM